MQALISGLRHPVKAQVKLAPSTHVSFEPQFFTKRGIRSAGVKSAAAAGEDFKLPDLKDSGKRNQETSPLREVVKNVYKSRSYKNVKSHFHHQRKEARENQWNPKLAHLERFYEDKISKKTSKQDKRLLEAEPPAGKPPVKDYLREMREQREKLEEAKAPAEHLIDVINNRKLSKLEKLNRIKSETHKMELIAKQHPTSLQTMTNELPKSAREAGTPGTAHYAQRMANYVDKPKQKIDQEFQKIDEANGMLLDAIKAKLAILDS